jgi:hypothetical protein
MAKDQSAGGKPGETKAPEGGTGSLSADAYDAEDVFEGAEPWDPIETKVVLGSFAAAVVCLIVFAILIHIYILD